MCPCSKTLFHVSVDGITHFRTECSYCYSTSAYGSEVGSAALKWIPKGGLYITGGIAPKNKDYFNGTNFKFMEAYYDKGRAAKILLDIPLFLVTATDLGVR